MRTPAQPVGEVYVLGQSRLGSALVGPAATVSVMIIGAMVLQVGILYIMGSFAIFGMILAVARRRNAVLGDDIGLLIRTRGGLSRSYAWSEIERMGWQHLGLWGSMLVVYPRGGPYDAPGPNSPIFVGRIWQPQRQRLLDPLPELMQRHGIKKLPDV